MNYKVVMAYDGSRYNGWQKEGNTDQTYHVYVVQILFKMTGEEIEVHGSGRTDAGVHARGQVANFHKDWKKLEVQFDAIYTGYLGSPKQIQIVSDFIRDFRQPDSLIVADPVLGDNGRLYANFDGEMVKEMRHLITKADVVTPNLTELFYLLDKPYKADNTDEELKEYLRLLSDKGPDVVIITSVPVHGEPHKTSVYAYNRQGIPYWKVTCPYLHAHYTPTGY